MSRRALLWLSGSVLLLVLGSIAFVVGRTGNGYLWLDGEPDPLSSDLSLFVAGGCDPEGLQIRSLTVDESTEAVEVEVLVRWPLGMGVPLVGRSRGRPM